MEPTDELLVLQLQPEFKTTIKHCLTLGWSEKHKSWKIQKYQADSKLRHRTDFRTIFGIMIG